ncbi:hypothetical protein B7P43_G17438 [Cryptotermes secundus]|uniref:Uncharacterized protein n=1 Tax=Cryptotermes secundus TaxID=105785 RepID=A0A2J7QCT2_9NEOP|nr:hypothetical protein B7P43_G17438 [Cryptotermes secundus]
MLDEDGSILIQEVPVIYSAMRLEALHCDMAVTADVIHNTPLHFMLVSHHCSQL